MASVLGSHPGHPLGLPSIAMNALSSGCSRVGDYPPRARKEPLMSEIRAHQRRTETRPDGDVLNGETDEYDITAGSASPSRS